MLHNLKKHISNHLGPKIRDKVIVFESDDWGMIRTSSKKALDNLGDFYPLHQCGYSSNDSLERDKDITGLLEILNANKSEASENQTPKITLNFVMFNPDFQRIRESQFNHYYRESFLTTYQNYNTQNNTFKLIQQGIQEGIFTTQFHATEHININNWMHSLKMGNIDTLKAFDYGMANLHSIESSNCQKEYLDAFGFRKVESIESLTDTFKKGIDEFKCVFGYDSKSFIAPCYFWDDTLETLAINNGVKVFQGSTVQKIPTEIGFIKKRHYMGEKGHQKQTYFIRNCQFERIDNPNIDWVERCLADISIAFQHKKPAVVSTHRVNYMGRLIESNRTTGLDQLDRLLKSINRKWPDVQYLGTAELFEKYYA